MKISKCEALAPSYGLFSPLKKPPFIIDMSLEQTVDNLEIRYANAVTFVGTSNTMIDTTTGRIQTKGFQHNSNVITDISGPHSRGVATLKKYPEIVFEEGKFDSNPTTNTFVQAGYTVTASSQLTGSTHDPWHAFDNTLSGNEGWITDSPRYNSSSPGEAQSGLGAIQFPAASGRYGEYIDLQLPSKIRVKHFIIKTRPAVASWEPEASPGAGYLYGSINGTDWTEIKAFSGLTYGGMGTDGGTQETVQVDSTTHYNYLRFQVTHRAGQNSTDQYAAVGELEYYGYEEDPPAGDHSVDTTFMSRFNNPQTTGVQVLIDGATGVGTNQISGGPDPSGNQSTYDSTGKYWTLNGTLTSNLAVEANTFLEGDQPHAVSVWFNSSNLEANVSNTCVFSISDQEKLDSVNLDLQSNTWHNLTYAYQGEGGSRVTYLDGRKVAEDQAEDTFGDYPPFAMTGYSQGGYVVSASAEHNSGNYPPWKLFDEILTDPNVSYETDGGRYDTTGAPYEHTAGVSTIVSGTPYTGDWVQVEFPFKFKVDQIDLLPQDTYGLERMPQTAIIAGSDDNTNWALLKSITTDVHALTVFTNYTVSATRAYKYIRFIWNTLTTAGSNAAYRGRIAGQEMRFYGHRENDLVRLPDPTNVLKYPHIAMTGPAQRGYVASASDEYYDGNYPAWDAFDSDSETGWIGYNGAWSGGAYQGGVGAVPLRNLGSDNGGTAITENGEWLIIQMPHKVLVSKVRLHERQGNTDNAPKNGRFYGSNDGTNWTALHSGFTNITYDNTKGVYSEINVNASIAYSRIALVVTAIVSSPWVGVGDMQIYGTGVDSIPIQIGGGNIDKVANFRVYDKFIDENQALEIWDAQKDAFGRAKSSMTLQKGRLGIGTTEPEGRLAVLDEPHNLEEFPPRAMTGYKNYFEGHGEFCVSESNVLSESYTGYKAFNKNSTGTSNNWWTQSDQGGQPEYSTSTGRFSSTDSHYATNVEGVIKYGQWLQIEFPYKINYKYSDIQAPHHSIGRQPRVGYIVGSNDLSGVWTSLHRFTDVFRTHKYESVIYTPPTVSTQTFKYFRLVIEELNNYQYAGIARWDIFGTREQGQSVLHDGQLTLTKNLNVPRIGPALDADDTPRRDRLVVEYNTSTNPTFEGVVRDTSGRGNDGVFYGGASYDATEKDLVFDGTDDYIEVDLGSQVFETNSIHTTSLWVKMNEHSSDFKQFFSLGNGLGNPDGNLKHIQLYHSTNHGLRLSFTQHDYRLGEVVPIGQWVHVAYTYDGTTWQNTTTPTNVNIYINGTKVSITSVYQIGGGGGSALDLSIAKLGLGAAISLAPGQNFTDCDISNFKLYDTALTAEEVKTLYDMGRCDEGHHVVNFSKTRVGIGLGDGEVPQATLDVRGDIAGPFTTFLTGDVTTSIVTSISSTSTIYPITSYTFDVPREYHVYGTKNLEIYGQIKWSGEANYAWNAMFSARVYYGSGLTSYIDSAENTSSDASTRNNGAGVIAVSHHSDFGSTIDSCIVGSRFYIPNCPVSNGSQLKLELRFRQGNSTASLYTNRTQADNTGDTNYERGTTNFFLVVK